MSLAGVLERSRELGFLGPGPIGTHVAHAEAFAQVLVAQQAQAAYTEVLDLGSGGGVPGLILAARSANLGLDGLQWTLLDASERRTAYLRDAVMTLGLPDRVSVVTGRAEELARDDRLGHRFGAVLARSFGPPAVTAECAAGFLEPSGMVLVSEPPRSASRDRWPTGGLAELGLVWTGQTQFGNAGIAVLRRVGAENPRYPRRVGVPSKRPLF